jgi:hypothetical protein
MAGRVLFRDEVGMVAPLWERVTTLTAVGLIVLVLPFGLAEIWLRHRHTAITVALAVAAIAYPVVQAFRITRQGAESAERIVSFVFVPLAFVLAVGITRLWLSHQPRWQLSLPLIVGASILFAGGVVDGHGPDWDGLPGPYLVAAGTHSIGPEGVGAAEWMRAYVGPGHGIATDFTDQLLAATYGGERPVTTLSDNVDVSPVFFSQGFGGDDASILERGKARYILVDQRLSSARPTLGFYFFPGEFGPLPVSPRLSPAQLTKFDSVQGISRVFDSGNIVIYDAGAMSHAP